MKALTLVGVVVAGLLASHDVQAVPPLNNTAEFLVGPFRTPSTPPTEGAVPARLESLAHDRCALPKGVWLRFEQFGADRYKGWSAQLQINDDGALFLVTHLGGATPEQIQKPAWPEQPTQRLDAATLAAFRKAAAALAAGPAYRGHAGLAHAPTFVVTVRGDKGEKQIVLEGVEDDFIGRLRRTTQFAHETPLGPAKAKPGKQPARSR